MVGVAVAPYAIELGPYKSALLLRQVVEDVPPLVNLAPMDQSRLAEGRVHRRPNSLAAVDHDQARAIGIESALDPVGRVVPLPWRLAGLDRGAPPHPVPDRASNTTPAEPSGPTEPRSGTGRNSVGAQVAQLRDLVMKEFGHVSKPSDECRDVL